MAVLQSLSKLIDRGLDRLALKDMDLARFAVDVGIHHDAGDHDGTSIAEYAIYNEYGTEHIPSRPFIRRTADENADKVATAAGRLADKVATGGMDARTAVAMLGQFYVDVQKRAIRNGPWVPNAPSTIKRKGSSRPLIDDAVMINAVRAKVK